MRETLNDVIWSGDVRGLHCRVWRDGHTDYRNVKGVYERADDASEIIAFVMAQLIERTKSAENEVLILRGRHRDARRAGGVY